jgi:hypothetical protein
LSRSSTNTTTPQLFAEDADGVGGSDVAGAELTDVDAAGQADEHTHGDRRHEVGEEAPGEDALAQELHAPSITAPAGASPEIASPSAG